MKNPKICGVNIFHLVKTISLVKGMFGKESYFKMIMAIKIHNIEILIRLEVNLFQDYKGIGIN